MHRYTRMHVYMYVHMYMYMYIVCIYVAYAYVHVYLYMCICTYAYMRTYIHRYMLVYVFMYFSSSLRMSGFCVDSASVARKKSLRAKSFTQAGDDEEAMRGEQDGDWRTLDGTEPPTRVREGVEEV